MADPTRLWFIRHGEVEADYVGTFLGSTDIGLSDLGRHQAQAVSSYLEEAKVDAVVSSPLQRARQTAAPVAEATGTELDVRRPFAEMDFGDWEGKAWSEIEAEDPAFAATWQADPGENACPNGDSANAFAARVHDGLQEVLETYRGRSVALFAHAGTNRAILSALLQCPYMESFVFAQDYGCVNAAAWHPEGGFGQVALVNLVPGPRSGDQGDGERADGA